MKGMGRKMKWIDKKWKQLSTFKRIQILLLAGTIVILAMTVGLRVWDREKQKPRVLMALKQLAEEAIEQKDSFASLLQLIQEGNIEQEGYVNFEQLDTGAFEWYSPWIEQLDMAASSIQYQVAFQQREGIGLKKAEYQIAEIGELYMESYLTKEKLIIRVPQLHSSYLRMSPNNIREQYRESFLYGVLGERLVLPKKDLFVTDIPVFPTEKELEKIHLIPMFLEEYKGRLTELWRQISVEKERETKQILVDGYYENCSVFRLSVPSEIIQWYIMSCLPDKVKEEIEWVYEKWEFVDLFLFLDDKNHIHCIETRIEPEIKGSIYPVQMVCYLKGEECLLDKIQIDLSILQPMEEIGLQIDFEKQPDQKIPCFYFSISQRNPEKSEQVKAYLTIDTITGESHIEYKINLPGVISDGEHTLRRLEHPIEVPDEEMVDIFELDLIEFLKFSKDFNFALFQ